MTTALTQTTAIFVDAYRDLNARKLFWVTLALSAIVVLAFALLGVTPTGLSLLTLNIPISEPGYWYRFAFSKVIGFWAAWGAVVLALVSTAGVFPDFLAGGSVDLYLSKPIGRLRLFATKYLTGLLFTGLQVLVFAALCFVVFGLRGHRWRPVLFLTVPLVMCLYTYLYAVTVLVGVLTRSTIAALLATIVCWLAFFLVNLVEHQLFEARVSQDVIARLSEQQAQRDADKLRELAANPSVTNAFGVRERLLHRSQERATAEAAESHQMADRVAAWHRYAFWAATVIPKTGETVDLLDRKLFSDADLAYRAEHDKEQLRGFMRGSGGGGDNSEMIEQFNLAKDAELEAKRVSRSRSVPWILGTSFAFEAVILLAAAWVFCRRDY